MGDPGQQVGHLDPRVVPRVDLPERAQRRGDGDTASARNVPSRATRPRVSALCSSCTTATDRTPALQNSTVSASAGTSGSSGGGKAGSPSTSRPMTPSMRAAESPRSAGTSAGIAATNRPTASRSTIRRRVVRARSTNAARSSAWLWSARTAAEWSRPRLVPAPYDGSSREQLEHPGGDERRSCRRRGRAHDRGASRGTTPAPDAGRPSAAARTCTRTYRPTRTAARR